MGKNTAIQWCDHTFNPWVGCTKISPGCDHCYAEGWAKRSGHPDLWSGSRRRTTPANWRQPLKWNAEAERSGVRARVFCASLADVFDNDVPGEWRSDLGALIRATPNLDWLLLTKRIGNAAQMLPVMDSSRPGYRPWHERWPWSNVWLGITVVTQEEADRDIPKLLATPARIRFLSCEPLLGPISLRKVTVRDHGWYDCLAGYRECSDWGGRENLIDWVIAGGESSSRARPMHPDWARSLRDQCVRAGVPFHFKQWGEWMPRGPEELGYPLVDGVPCVRLTDRGQNGQDLGAACDNQVWMQRAGKKRSGRLLDGRTWDQFPEVRL